MRTLATMFIGILSAGILSMGTAFSAEPYPVRPIRMIVGFAPGGGTDLTARPVAQKLSRAARSAGHRRESPRRRRQHRHRAGGEGGARRLYASHGHHCRARDQSQPIWQSEVRSRNRPRAGDPGGGRHQRARAPPLRAGELGEGADRARQGEIAFAAFLRQHPARPPAMVDRLQPRHGRAGTPPAAASASDFAGGQAIYSATTPFWKPPPVGAAPRRCWPPRRALGPFQTLPRSEVLTVLTSNRNALLFLDLCNHLPVHR